MANDKKQDDFRNIYDQVFPIISKVVYRITADVHITEEICQEAFIRYYNRIDSVPGGDQAKFWLIRVAKNLAFNHEKRKGREKKAYDRMEKEPFMPPDTGETLLLKKEAHSTIQKALDSLPRKLKSALILKLYGQLSYREIGAILGISEGNVKVRIHRAREKLSTHIKEDDIYVP